MEIKITNQGHVTVARVLDSRLSANVSSEFKFLMGQQIGSGRNNLVLDLSEVTFMDSSGLGAVISLLKLIGTKGDLAIACPQAPHPNLVSLNSDGEGAPALPDRRRGHPIDGSFE